MSERETPTPQQTELAQVVSHAEQCFKDYSVLEQELASCKADAERWRRIRKSATSHYSALGDKWWWEISVMYTAEHDMGIDAAIDAAIRGENAVIFQKEKVK